MAKHRGAWGSIEYEYKPEIFQQRMREALDACPASWEAIAADVGMDPHTIKQAVTRQSGVRLATAAKLAYRLGVSMDYLLGLSDYSESDEAALHRAAEILETTPERLWQLYGAEVF